MTYKTTTELKQDLKDAVALLERIAKIENAKYCSHCGELKTHALNCLIRDINDWLWYYRSE